MQHSKLSSLLPKKLLPFSLNEKVLTFSVKSAAVKALTIDYGRAVPLTVQVKVRDLKLRQAFVVVHPQNFTQMSVILIAVILMAMIVIAARDCDNVYQMLPIKKMQCDETDDESDEGDQSAGGG